MSVSIYLGQKGYTIFKESLDVKEQLLIRKELEVAPWVPKSSFHKPPAFPIYRESKKKFYIPRFYGIDNYGEAEENRISGGEDIDLTFVGTLRPPQVPAANAFLNCKKKCGLLELYCGFGKTCIALYIISKLRKKTLIIVHKSFLMNQWKERINQFLPEAKVGIIQGETIDVEGKDIVLGMLQSISMKEYPCSLFQQFGLTVIDETHHISAEVFSRSLFKIVTQYMLGLSATMNRKDGLTRVFKMFLGEVVYKKERKNSNVTIKAIKYENTDEEYSADIFNFRNQIFYAKMINKLCEFNRRSEFILKVLIDILKDRDGQQIMILAHNKSLLKYFYDAIKHRNLATVGYYIGGMKEKDLKITETMQVVIATYAMAAEGLDIKTLTTLFLATPKTDVTQAVGRILRKTDVNALVIDIIDQHGIFHRQWLKRRAFYKKSGFEIMITDNNDYSNNKWQSIKKKQRKKKPMPFLIKD